ncbi:TPA: lactaldehyde reductase [Candidatus Ventrenecus stercoripullorum]|nr:lactaldehyde reductase [Candidatus Ventrenecus stercoripullorum]
MANRIILNETSYFGWNAREHLVPEIQKRQFKKILVVTDETLMKCDVASKVIDALKEGNISFEVFDKVKPNPTIKNCHDGIDACKKTGADAIVAVGGGSVIDTAKCIGIVINNPEFYDINSLEGTADTKNKSLPIIALPTTAGTAAEVTINYVITDEENVVKRVCVDPNDIPIVSIIDTELMSGMPRMTAAATGLDALTHAMEGYITKAHWEMTDMFHLKSMELTYRNLVSAVDKDREAMDMMGLSQYIAGMGFSNVGLGIVHSMAHQLGATYDVAHGIACSLFLPYVLEWNGEVVKSRFRDMAKAFGLHVDERSDEVCVSLVVNAVRDLETRLGVPQHLNELGVKKEDFEVMAEKALRDPCTGGNPREVTKEDIIMLMERAY